MRLEFLGTGTSTGVPQIGCDCAVCHSSDIRDQRTRCSVWIRAAGKNIIIDTGPDFRIQCLRSGIPRIDAILFTHFHADHVFGLDDARLYNVIQKEKIPIYVPDFMAARFALCFDYTLEAPKPGLTRPHFQQNIIRNEPIQWENLSIIPVDVYHGLETIKGYVFSSPTVQIAYLIDCKSLPDETIALVKNSDVVILSALWKKKNQHPSHLNLDEAIELSQRLESKQIYLSHITHHMGLHQETELTLPANIALAYDGLIINIP